ncbi:hypothetical protein J7E71_17910 [Mesobacillus foraminis]|uniref:DUF1641 domain-containing protein n=1 Tax=Mesobacillus foraminis TaxID=279826 RepID=UPI001BE720E5|nr:hypothetical protein [Mesobacillus foraminis]MBT2757763.1 hypothetical protein [Mesobacillus foraminis]
MAKAIRQIRKEVQNHQHEHQEAIDDILKELVDNREAIMGAIGILKGLQEMRVLETVGALLEQRNEVGAIAIQQINQPTVHNVVKSGINVFKFIGSLQPSELETILDGVALGLKRLSETSQKGKKQSIWKMQRRLRSPEIRAVVITMMDFMEGMGQAFLKNREEKQ